MNDRIFEQVKLLLNSFSHEETGMHDSISARRAMIETGDISVFISLYDLAKDITYDNNHEEAVETFTSLSYSHKRIVIWCLTNLHSREVCQIVRQKQHAIKLLRLYGKD